MRNSFYVGMIFILLASIGLGVKFNLDLEDFQTQVAIERNERDKKIEELEKEIRILKTDIHILQYGYEKEENK